MGNMRYCRFNNTKLDMGECIEALQDRENLSDDEKDHAKDLLNEILSFCMDEGIIDDFDENKIDEIVNECNEENKDE